MMRGIEEDFKFHEWVLLPSRIRGYEEAYTVISLEKRIKMHIVLNGPKVLKLRAEAVRDPLFEVFRFLFWFQNRWNAHGTVHGYVLSTRKNYGRALSQAV